MKGYEGLLASRYLKRRAPRGKRVYLFPLALALLCVIGRLAHLYIAHRYAEALAFNDQVATLQTTLYWVSLGLLCATVFMGVLAALLRHLTISSTISTFGLFIGSSALVVVLSVMSGFEQDLKGKILGANAHILVTRPDHPFTGYAAVIEQVRAVPGVESVTPYLSSEAMISSPSNVAGILIKGIDPASAERVTELGKHIQLGSIDHLIHPEKILNPPTKAGSDKKAAGLAEPPGGAKEAQVTDSKGTGGHGTTEATKTGAKADPSKIHDPITGKTLDLFGPDSGSKTPAPRAAIKVLPGLIIGSELQKNLRVWPGDDVNIISPLGDIGPTGPMPRSRPFRIAGTFYTGMYEYDTKYVYMTIEAAQRFLGLDDEITGLELRVRDPDATGPIADQIRALLDADHAGYEVADWQQLNRNLFSALKIEKLAMFIALSFIILVAGFSIVANGIMLVREREREIAILKSMGATDKSVLGIFVYLGLYVGLVGTGLGILTGIGTCLALSHWGLSLNNAYTDVYYITKLPVQMSLGELGSVFAAAMSIAMAATLYPASIAARLRPVDGLRSDQG